MATLSDLSVVDRAHWKLHLNAVIKDTPSLEEEVKVFLKGGELPNLKHPAYIHYFLEQPDRRIEKWLI